MRRRAVEVEVIFFDVFAVVPFAIGEPEETFLEDRVFAVPERERKAQPLLVVGDPGKAVFAPTIGARAGVIVGEDSPRHRPLRCNLRGRCPTGVRSGRGPTSSRAFFPGGFLRAGDVQQFS